MSGKQNRSKPHETIEFALSETFGGPATADWVKEDQGYTISQNGLTVAVHRPVDKVIRAQELFESGDERKAYFTLVPLL